MINRAVRGIAMALLLFAIGCTDAGPELTIGRAEAIARQALANEGNKELFARKGVDLTKLPPPASEARANNILVEFRDPAQNIWIVVMVDIDGRVEITSTALNG
jgi:hypothetical protein